MPETDILDDLEKMKVRAFAASRGVRLSDLMVIDGEPSAVVCEIPEDIRALTDGEARIVVAHPDFVAKVMRGGEVR